MSAATGVRERWVQLNVGLARRNGQALPSAHALFTHLSPVVARYRRARRLRWFLFVRKPPDVRLRLLGPNPEALARELSGVLDALRRGGHVRRFFRSVYEPETRQFGGPEAMAHVHAYFDADTAAWMALDRVAEAGERAIPTEVLNMAVLNDLFYRTLDCAAEEVWDVWANCLELLGACDGTPVETNARIELLDDLFPSASRGEAPVIRRYGRANRALATGLQQVWGRGRLGSGLRAVLPFVALVHFNRYGLNGIRQLPLVRSMVGAWSPTRRFIGADITPPAAPRSTTPAGPRPT